MEKDSIKASAEAYIPTSPPCTTDSCKHGYRLLPRGRRRPLSPPSPPPPWLSPQVDLPPSLTPGPRGFPIIGALPLVGAKAHANLARLAKRYGPIMFLRLGSHGCVVASNADAARAFLKTHDAQFANRPDPLSARDVSYQRQDLVMADYNPTWKLLRKVCSLHMLGGKAFAGWAAVRRDEFGRMIRSMHGLATKGEPVVLSDVLVCALANILGMVLVSRRVFDTHGEESNKFKNIVLDMLTGGAQFNIGDFFPSIAWMDLQGIQAKMRSVHVRFDAMLTKLLQEHEASKKERQGRPDFIDKHMENRNPAILKRAQAEADAVVGRDRLLEESDLPKLAYLQAVCKEALRLHPSTPLSLPHFSYEECEVDNYRIPSNSRLLVNIWAIGRDPKVWADPLVFDPDRFVAGGEEPSTTPRQRLRVHPLRSWEKDLLGKLTGMVFVQYMLGALVHSFDWRLPDGEEELDMEEKHGLTISKAVPLKVLLTPRLSAAAYI
ncbi:Cytochrome P450 [Musa troglodytarum]|uniref:Cytochrome P450 n=1 Tax=Musa troglodytarum TaxID=320322 RepID=A0A9E7IH81_9LILI|nr:Cytochrome P450 [Musa troglodytarum]